MGIDEEIAGKCAASEQDRAFHVTAIGEGEFDGKIESTDKDCVSQNDGAMLGDACGVADGLGAREGSTARNGIAMSIGRLEMNNAGIGIDHDIRRMNCGSARSGIDLRDPWLRAQIRQAQPFMPSDEQT